MSFFYACSGVLTVFAVGLVGYILARKQLVTPETKAALPRLLTYIVLPPFMLRNVTTIFSREQVGELGYGALIPLASVCMAFLAAALIGKFIGMPKGRKGTFCTAIATSNTVNIGIPINIALFGEASLPYVLFYIFGHSIFYWTLGCYSIAYDGKNASVKLLSLDTLAKIFSPPLVGFLCGIALVLLGLELPTFLDKAFQYVGNMAVGLSLIYIGILQNDINPLAHRPEKGLVWILAGRFIISPLCIVLLTWFIDIPPLMRNVFIIQASLPVMMNVAIMAGYYKADMAYATLAVSLSTFLSLITIPIYMILISSLM